MTVDDSFYAVLRGHSNDAQHYPLIIYADDDPVLPIFTGREIAQRFMESANEPELFVQIIPAFALLPVLRGLMLQGLASLTLDPPPPPNEYKVAPILRILAEFEGGAP
jgi:hypothetical protein